MAINYLSCMHPPAAGNLRRAGPHTDSGLFMTAGGLWGLCGGLSSVSWGRKAKVAGLNLPLHSSWAFGLSRMDSMRDHSTSPSTVAARRSLRLCSLCWDTNTGKHLEGNSVAHLLSRYNTACDCEQG